MLPNAVHTREKSSYSSQPCAKNIGFVKWRCAAREISIFRWWVRGGKPDVTDKMWWNNLCDSTVVLLLLVVREYQKERLEVLRTYNTNYASGPLIYLSSTIVFENDIQRGMTCVTSPTNLFLLISLINKKSEALEKWSYFFLLVLYKKKKWKNDLILVIFRKH